jgi:hypothetical protein
MKEEWENMDTDFWLPLKYEDPSLGGYNAVAIKKGGKPCSRPQYAWNICLCVLSNNQSINQSINQLINLILLTASELVLAMNIDEILLKDAW